MGIKLGRFGLHYFDTIAGLVTIPEFKF